MDKYFVELMMDNKLDSFLDYFMIIITKMGDGLFFIILLVLLFLLKRTRKTSLILASSYASSAVIMAIIKNIVKRPRPFVAYNFDIIISRPHGEFSFPSGHATSSFALCFMVFLLFRKSQNKKLRILAYLSPLVAFLISISRVYLGVHYFTDILTGAILGILVASTIHYILKRKCIVNENEI